MRRFVYAADTVSAATVLAMWAFLTAVATAQDPLIERINPTAVQTGREATITVQGQHLGQPVTWWTPVVRFDAGPTAAMPDDKSAVFTGTVPAETAAGIYPARVVTQQGTSAQVSFVVDSLPLVALPDSAQDRATPLSLPQAACVSGQLNPVKPRYFQLSLTADQPVRIEVFARRLNSALDPVLRLLNPDGTEAAFVDDVAGLEGDAQLEFTAPATADYLLELSDVQFGGSSQHVFHLRVGGDPLTFAPEPEPGPVTTKSPIANILTETEPNDSQQQPTAVDSTTPQIQGAFHRPGDTDWYQFSGTAGQPVCITAHTRRRGSPADLILRLRDTSGKLLTENDDSSGQDAQLTAALPADGDYLLEVSEISGQGGEAWTYELEWNHSGGRLEATAVADHVSVPRGGTASLPVTLQRIGVLPTAADGASASGQPATAAAEGPQLTGGTVQIEAVGLPPTLHCPSMILAPGQTTAPVTITGPATAAAAEDGASGYPFGPFTLVVTADGVPLTTVRYVASADDKAKQGYRSPQAPDGLFVATAPTSAIALQPNVEQVSVPAGGTATVSLTAVRQPNWTQPIEVAALAAQELPAGLTVSAATVQMAEGTVTITAAADISPGHCCLFLQGTATQGETTITVPVPAIRIQITGPNRAESAGLQDAAPIQ